MYFIASGQKKYQRAPALLAQASEHLPAIQPWQHHVENDEIEWQFSCEVQPIQSISGDIDNETCLSKSLLQELGGLGSIFDNQNSHESQTSKLNLTENCSGSEACRPRDRYRMACVTVGYAVS